MEAGGELGAHQVCSAVGTPKGGGGEAMAVGLCRLRCRSWQTAQAETEARPRPRPRPAVAVQLRQGCLVGRGGAEVGGHLLGVRGLLPFRG